MAIKMLRVFVVSCVMVAMVTGSAIPMWEYLTKDEKMAYLYNMFANQVEEFCNFSSKEDCNKELLKHGLKNLHGMPEDHLDVMDPYQRGATSLIWESMMEGHEMMKKATPGTTTTTEKVKQDSYDFSDSNYLGSASSRHETVLNLRRVTNKQTSTTTPKQSPNSVAPTKISYGYGPMVVKVHPDGTPVQEDQVLPMDDDIHHYMMMKTKVPTMSQFETKKLPREMIYNTSPYGFYLRTNIRQ